MRTSAELEMEPRHAAAEMEIAPRLPGGKGDRFSGYGVTGVTFASGHVLALRRFPASSVGPPFSSVWHRTPAGVWTFYSDVDPSLGCNRYFGGEGRAVEDEISIDWSGRYGFSVRVHRARIAWAVHLAPTSGTRALSALTGRIPDALWRNRPLRAGLGRATERLLQSGRIALDGMAPSGHCFAMDLHRCWMVDASAARIGDRHLGPTVLPHVQDRLGEFWIPCWGVFLMGGIRFLRHDDD
jgi:hypothetical protein